MKIFEVKKDQFIFYPKKEDLTALGIILCLCLYMIAIPAILTIKNIHLPIIIAILTIPILILLICILLGKMQIIIDAKEKTVVRKNLLGQRKLAGLDDIINIRFSTRGSMYVTSYIYELIFKDDMYGEGIVLTPRLRKKSKRIKYIQEQVIDKIEYLLDKNNVSKENIKKNDNIRLLKETRREHYTYDKKSLLSLIISVGSFFLFAYIAIYVQPNEYYYFFILLISSIFLASYGSSIQFNNVDKVIESSVFGFFKRSLKFDDVKDIRIIHNSTNGKYTHTDIKAISNKGGKYREMLLFMEKDTKKIPILINDLEILLGRNFDNSNIMI